jgi:mono/diheme cytochrome c family protein
MRTVMWTMALVGLMGCGEGDESAAEVSGADFQAFVDDNCAGCHTGGGANGGLAMDDAVGDTVDVASAGNPAMVLVSPGSLEDSYLWAKLNDTQGDVGGAGDVMPTTGVLADLSVVEDWILAGAPD